MIKYKIFNVNLGAKVHKKQKNRHPSPKKCPHIIVDNPNKKNYDSKSAELQKKSYLCTLFCKKEPT